MTRAASSLCCCWKTSKSRGKEEEEANKRRHTETRLVSRLVRDECSFIRPSRFRLFLLLNFYFLTNCLSWSLLNKRQDNNAKRPASPTSLSDWPAVDRRVNNRQREWESESELKVYILVWTFAAIVWTLDCFKAKETRHFLPGTRLSHAAWLRCCYCCCGCCCCCCDGRTSPAVVLFACTRAK